MAPDVEHPFVSSTEPSGAGVGEPTFAGQKGESEECCIMLGPSNAGKTCTLIALSASCHVDARDPDTELSVRNDPTVDKSDLLNRYATRWICYGDHPPATEERRDFKVEVAVQLKGRLFRPARSIIKTLRCSDGRGGNLFYTEADHAGGLVDPQTERRFLDQAADASTLVLVVDSTSPASTLFEQSLSRILDHIGRPRESESVAQPVGVRLLRWIGLAAAQRGGRRSRLKASRVLLLLTKIDALAQSISEKLRAHGINASPLRIASCMDPVALAIELLGPRALRRIRSAMDGQATLAAGLASATGFVQPSGATFLQWSQSLESLGCPDKDADRRNRQWSPFGIRDVLMFVTTGRCSGTVLSIGRDDDLNLAVAQPVHSYPLGD